MEPDFKNAENSTPLGQGAAMAPGFVTVATPQPCPSCGHCPTCGRGPVQPFYWHPYQPYWYGPTVVQCGSTSMGADATITLK